MDMGMYDMRVAFVAFAGAFSQDEMIVKLLR